MPLRHVCCFLQTHLHAFLPWLLLLASPAVEAQTLQLTPGDILRRAVPEAPTGKSAPAQESEITPPPASPTPKVTQPPPLPTTQRESQDATSIRETAEAAERPRHLAQGYLYLEPGQARFEVLFDIETLLKLLGESTEPDAILEDATRQRLLKAMAERAEAWCRVYDSRTPLQGTMSYPTLLTGKPGATLPIEPGKTYQVRELMLGLIWLFPLPPTPKVIETQWQGFFPESGEIPSVIFWGPKSQPAILSLKKPYFTWQNLNRIPAPAPLVLVPPVSSVSGMKLPAGFLLWLIAGAALWRITHQLKQRRQKLPGGAMPYVIVWAASAVLLWSRLHIPLPGLGTNNSTVETPEQAARIVEPLLLNTYRAFDHRSESAIYDVLARSVEGELLRRLYLETIEALSIEGREEARVTVREFSAEVDSVTPTEGGFSAHCEWTALGTVGHWGHTHTRVNRYKARITITAIAGAWKLTALEVDQAVRL